MTPRDEGGVQELSILRKYFSSSYERLPAVFSGCPHRHSDP